MDVCKADKIVIEDLLQTVANLDPEVRFNGRIRDTLPLDLTSGVGFATHWRRQSQRSVAEKFKIIKDRRPCLSPL